MPLGVGLGCGLEENDDWVKTMTTREMRMLTVTVRRKGVLAFVFGLALLTLPWAVAAAQDAADAAAQIQAHFAPILASYSKIVLGPGGPEQPDCITFAVKNKMLSKELRRLLEKEVKCQERTQGICKLDFDFLFNARDSESPLEIVKVYPQDGVYLMQVSSGIKGAKPYEFVLIQESGAWVMDDVRYHDDARNHEDVKTTSLKGILK